MFTDLDFPTGSAQGHPAQQWDGEFEGFTGLEAQSSKGDPAFIGHEEAEAEKSEPNRKSQGNHLFVQQSVDHLPRERGGPPQKQAAGRDPGMQKLGMAGQERELGIQIGVGACGELGKANAEGDLEVTSKDSDQ